MTIPPRGVLAAGRSMGIEEAALSQHKRLIHDRPFHSCSLATISANVPPVHGGGLSDLGSAMGWDRKRPVEFE